MASGQTHADDVLNVFKNTAYSGYANVYISLHTADPGATGASEVSTSGTAYARQTCAAASFGTITGTAGTDRNVPFDAAINFATATGSGFGTCTHLGFWDASSAGNFLCGGALDSSQAVAAGVDASFASGAAKIEQL